MPRKKKHATTPQDATATTDLLIGLIVDKSGSMETVRDATISGFNEFLSDQQRTARTLGGRTLLSLTLFDTQVQTPQVTAPIAGVPPLDRHSYVPGGNTALYDAIGATIRSIEQGGEGAHPGVPAKKLIVIQTDGFENSSREWTRAGIFTLISQKRAEGWAFLFLGADQDAFAAGAAIGIAHGSTLNYASAQTQQTFTASSASATGYRTGALNANHLAPDPADRTPTP